ncbi:unnamed protein product [Leuciscus chuanchicus]
MRKVFEGRRGVQLDENGSSVTDLMFADDSGVLAKDDAEATDILYEIASVAQSYGLKINVDQTKVLTTDGSPADVNLDGIQIEQVQKEESCVYGGDLQSNWPSNRSIRLAKVVSVEANQCFYPEVRLFRTLILLILLYGSETWTVLKADLNKLEVFQIMSGSRLPHQLLWHDRPSQWRIQRTAPKKTWLKQVEEDIRNRRINIHDARTTALDRPAWKRLVNEIRQPLVPTAAYGLRSQSRPSAS